MTKLRKCFVWFFMLSKRLLFQWSFVALLCFIPISVALTNIAMSQESGIVHVMLCNESNDPDAEKIIQSLIEEDSVLMFSRCETEKEAEDAVKNLAVDAAWIFPDNFVEKIDNYALSTEKEPFLRLIEREKSMTMDIAREKLFGAVYSEYSRAIYENFSYSEIVSEEEVSSEKVKSYYDSLSRRGEVIRIERLNDSSPEERTVTYLTAPIRGILSLMVILCTLTAAMYFLREQAAGKFAWVPLRKRVIPAMASCLSAAVLSGIAVLGAIQCSGISIGFGNELLSMIFLVISATGFCMTLSGFFRSAGKFGAAIPGIIIIMLVLSPIFFNLKALRFVRLMLPSYYYLYSVYNSKYFLYTALYSVGVYALGFVANYFLAERRYNQTII